MESGIDRKKEFHRVVLSQHYYAAFSLQILKLRTSSQFLRMAEKAHVCHDVILQDLISKILAYVSLLLHVFFKKKSEAY